MGTSGPGGEAGFLAKGAGFTRPGRTHLAKQSPRSSTKPSGLPLNLYVSTALRGDIAQLLGAPHYSYHFAAQAFRAMLGRRGVTLHHLEMPEYYATGAALPERADAPDLHLIFRSTDQIRLLKPAVNICCFAWEFPVLRTDTLPGDHPFANQRSMLDLCDEVWTPSSFAQQVLRDHGLAQTRRIPAPVVPPAGGRRSTAEAVAGLGGLPAVTLDINFTWPESHHLRVVEATATTLGAWIAAHGGARRPVIFLCVLNPEDFRKNLDALIRGFHHFRRNHPRTVLVVKLLTSGSRFSLAEAASGVVRNKLAGGTVLRDDGIAFINAYLTDAEMSLLYSLADFYLCTSLAEGQNLPLLEAMAHGTVAVTTRNTAMDDYITEDNAFIIPAREVMNDTIHLAGTLARRPFCVSMSTARNVYEALCRAQAAGKASRAARARAGIATVAAQFGEDAVWGLVQARLLHHASRGAA